MTTIKENKFCCKSVNEINSLKTYHLVSQSVLKKRVGLLGPSSFIQHFNFLFQKWEAMK